MGKHFTRRQKLVSHPLFVRLSTVFLVTALLTLISAAGAFALTRFVGNLTEIIDQAVALQSRLHLVSAQIRGAEAAAAGSDRLSIPVQEIDALLADPVFASLRGHGSEYAPTAAFEAVDAGWRKDVKPRLLIRQPDPQRVIPSLDNLMQKAGKLVNAIDDDIAVKHSAMLWLQFACLTFALTGAALGIHYSHGALVKRLGRLIARIPLNGSRRDSSRAPADEIEKLSMALDALLTDTARAAEDIDALQHEVRAGLGRRSLELLFNVNQLLNDLPLGEGNLLRVLSELERTIGVDASAIFLAEGAPENRNFGSPIISGEVKLTPSQTRSFEEPADDCRIGVYDSGEPGQTVGPGWRVRALTVPLKQQEQALGVMILEANPEFQFEEWQIQLAELVGRQIAIAIGSANLAYEGRRIALLEERAAIARELHDSIAQSLSYMKIQISRLETMINMGQPAEEIHVVMEELREGLNGAYRKLRELLTTFRVKVSARGLGEALGETMAEFGKRSGLTLRLDNRLRDCRLTSNEEVHVLQIIREALSNVVRHAHATSALVALDYDADKYVTVIVDDDGIGIGECANPKYHHGMIIMQERVNSLGGELKIESHEGGGTRVKFRFTPALIGSRELLARKV